MSNKNLKAFSSNPLYLVADFYVLGLRRLFKVFKKAVALALLLTFTGSQIVFAADPRELLAQAKAGFENPDQGRLGGSGYEPSQFIQSQSNQQNVVDQQNALQELQNLSFSLTTQNGDILNYVNNKLNTVQTHDGNTLRNIVLNSDGTIQNADLKLSDGSIQLYGNGQILAYLTPDGTSIEYDAITGKIKKTTSKDGVISNYSYMTQDGAVITVVQTGPSTSYYAPDGKLWFVQKSANEAYMYLQGRLWQAWKEGYYVYNERVLADGTIASSLAPDSYLPIQTYDFVSRDNAWRKFASENSIGTSVQEKPISYNFSITQKGDVRVSFDAKSFGNPLPSGYANFTLRYFLDKDGVVDSQGETFKVDANDLDWQNGEVTLQNLDPGSYTFRFYLEAPEAHSGCESVASCEANETPKGCELSIVNFKFKNLKFNHLVYPSTDLPKEVIYDENSVVQKVRLFDETVLYFEGGLLQEAHSRDGRTTDFSFDESLFGNVLSASITENNLKSTYDSEGKLTSIKLEDLTIHYQNSQVSSIQKDDGTELEGLTFDANGNILNATIITPDGEVRIYENGALKSLERQDTKIFYDLGKPLQLIQNDLTYDFTYTPEKITAVIASEPGERGDLGEIASSTTRNDVIAYEYDSNFNLKKQILQNNSIIEYLEDPDYSFKLTEDSAISYYDANNQIQKTIINATAENPHTLEVIYQYGKIRRILKDTIETFKYSYTFDPDGSEKTIIQDLEEHTTKTYKNSLLLTSFDEENSVLSTYEYVIASPAGAWQSDEIASSPTPPRNDRVHKVTVTRLGRLLHTYDYSYADSNTIVQDEEDTIRTYNTQNKLIFLEKDKRKWAYSYTNNEATTLIQNLDTEEEIVTETLLEKILSDGSVAYYDNSGQLLEIELSNGVLLQDISLSSQNNLRQFTADFGNGLKRVYSSDGALLEEHKPNGEKFFYKNNLLHKVQKANNQEAFYTYEVDEDENITAYWIEENGLKLKYGPGGELLGLKLNGILNPEEIELSTQHSYSSSGEGRLSHDNDFATAQVTSQSQEGVGSINQTLYSEHTFTAPQTLNEITFSYLAQGASNGNTNNGSGVWGYVETKDASTGEWTLVPGSYRIDEHNADGSGTSSYLNPGITALPISLSNVIAIRAHVGGGAYANRKGSGSGSTWLMGVIHEIQWVLSDQSVMNFNPETETFWNALGSIQSPEGLESSSGSNLLEIQEAVSALNQNPSFLRIDQRKKRANVESFSSFAETLSDATEKTITIREYSSGGVLEAQTEADGAVTLFDDQNKPERVLDSEGRVLIEYSYDNEGNPSKVYLKNARSVLPDEILKAKQNIEEEKTKELEALLIQKQIAYQAIKDRSGTEEAIYKAQVDLLESQKAFIESFKVQGKRARSQKADALSQVQESLGEVLNGLSNLLKQRSEAYEALDAQVKVLSDQIESDAESALTHLAQEEKALKKEILRQEVSPIVYDYYRRILGRDPSSQEYEYWIAEVDYDSAEGISAGSLLNFLNSSNELSQRQAYVQSIKSAVSTQIAEYLDSSSNDKSTFIQNLGLSQNEIIALTESDANKILNWLDTRSLHFGQSAFLSLEALLDQKGIAYTREELATKCILIDILSGVISPLDDGDLVISVFALNKVAGLYALNLSGANLNWDDLKKLYDDNRAVIEGVAEILPASSMRFDGNGDYVSIADSHDFDFSEGVFTIEAWVNPSLNPPNATVFGQKTDPDNFLTLYIPANGSVQFISYRNGVRIVDAGTPAGVVAANTWSHIAWVEDGDNYYVFVNGELKATCTTQNRVSNYTGPVTIGSFANDFEGLIDGVRISKGIARFTQNFVPEAHRYNPDSHTKLLLYSNSIGSIKDFSSLSRPVELKDNVSANHSSYAQSIKKITGQKVITRYPSIIANPSTLTQAQKDDIISDPIKYNPRVIAHINGNHYVIITNITDNSITYLDPGAGPDKQNEVVTISKKDFLKAWRGNVTAESSMISAVIPSPSTSLGVNSVEGSRFLTKDDTQKIRGAFFFFFVPAIAGALSSIGGAIAGVLASIGGFITSIGTLVGNVLGGLGQFLGGVLKGIGYLGNTLWQGIHYAASSLWGVLGNPGTLLSQASFGSTLQASFGQQIFQTAVRTGLNFAVSRGLEGLGINPAITNFVSAFVSGGVQGGFTSGFSASNFIQGGMKHLALQGTQTLSQNIGLSSNLETAIGIFADGFSNGLEAINLGDGIVSVVTENLAKASAYYGLSTLGSNLGLGSSLASAFALPIAGSIARSFDVGRIVGEDIIQSVWDGITGSVLQAGVEFAVDEMDLDSPLLKALSSAVLTQSVSSLLDPNGNIIQDLLSKAGEFSQKFLGDIGSSDFVRHVTEHGTASALESYAAVIFSRQATEAIHGMGGIAQVISGRSELVDYNGTTLTRVNITSAEGFMLGPQGEFLGTFRTVNGVKEEALGQFNIHGGKSKLINGTVRQVHPNGEVSYIEVRGGKVYRLVLNTKPAETSKATVKIIPCPGSETSCIEFDIKEGNPAEAFWSWEVVQNYDGELNIDGFNLIDGLFFINQDLSFNVSDLFGTSLGISLSGDSSANADDRLDEDLYVLTNGILNDQSKSEGAPKYLENLKEDIVKQSEDKVDSRDIITAATYFTSPVMNILLDQVAELAKAGGIMGELIKRLAAEIIVKIFNGSKDVLSWIAEAADPYAASFLTDEVQAALDAYFGAYGNGHKLRDIIAVGYSGGFLPTVEALTQPGYAAKTYIALGAATINPEAAAKDLLVKVMEAADYLANPLNLTRETLNAILESADQALVGRLGVGLTREVIEQIIEFIAQETPKEAYNRYIERLAELGDLIDNTFNGFALDDLTSTSAQMIVNIYGTKDILADIKINNIALGGYREEMAGFLANSKTVPLVNIEILGATHFDYMRSAPPGFDAGIIDLANYLLTDKGWNETVSAFVADVAVNSADYDALTEFLRRQFRIGIAEEVGDKWIIRLPGWESRV